MKLGMDGIPGLSLLWNLHPLTAALVVAFVDFGIVCILMVLEGRPPWERGLYKTFLINDSIFIPLYVAMAVVVMRSAGDQLQGFYAQRWFHVAILATGFALSLFREYSALTSGEFNWSQELSPSKLWHTFVFGVMFYWVFALLAPVILIHRPVWAMALIMVAVVGIIWMIRIDDTSPQPQDAHLEGSYIPWEWHVRKE